MATDVPIKSERVTAATAAATLTLELATKWVQVVNLSAYSAYVRTVQLGGTAAAASGSLYIAGTAGYERSLGVGSGETLSYIRGASNDATLEITQYGA